MDKIYKYPRTKHIEGSNIQVGDEDLKNISFNEIKHQYIVLEEKVDGANCGISFDSNKILLLQSRGHYLNGGYGEEQFSLFKTWANCHKQELYELLGNRYILYGEWLYAKHTVFYDALTHYFMEFDIYDKEQAIFLSTARRKTLLKDYPFIISVLVLYEGTLDCLEQLISYIGPSHFKTDNYKDAFQQQCEMYHISYEIAKNQTDLTNLMEGIYIKVEEEENVIQRLKYVRNSFFNTILNSQTHWINRPLLPNRLKDNKNLFEL